MRGLTIAIPTHDRRETLLLAVRSALAQTLSPSRVLVLCDGCTDGSAEAVRALGDARVEALELDKLPGYAYAHRNLALETSDCEAVMWLGDDDLLLPDHVQRVAECWDAHRPVVVQTLAAVIWEDDSGTLVGLDWSVERHRRTLAERNTNVMSSVTVSVAAARAAGGWDSSQERFGDWDLWKRVLAGGAPSAMTGEPTVLHFRATGRRQAWSDRVQQNTRWIERLSDARELTKLRSELARLRSLREAEWIGDLERARNELHEARLEVERLRVLEAELGRVYSGGWWRMRARLAPALRLAARARGRG